MSVTCFRSDHRLSGAHSQWGARDGGFACTMYDSYDRSPDSLQLAVSVDVFQDSLRCHPCLLDVRPARTVWHTCRLLTSVYDTGKALLSDDGGSRRHLRRQLLVRGCTGRGGDINEH